LVFGLIAASVYHALSQNVWIAFPLAFVSTIVLGIFWSMFGRDLLIRFLRLCRIYSDVLPSAWFAVFTERTYATQLTVKLNDGSWLKCDDVHRFEKKLNGPCIFGVKGDLLMYVTHSFGRDVQRMSHRDRRSAGR
jgi:hypothetical protein